MFIGIPGFNHAYDSLAHPERAGFEKSLAAMFKGSTSFPVWSSLQELFPALRAIVRASSSSVASLGRLRFIFG